MRYRYILLILSMVLASSCGTSYKRSLADAGIQSREVVFSQEEMVIYIDDPARTRRNADKVFQSWIQSRDMQRHVTGRRLYSVAPREDGCHLVYDFRMVDGSQQRVTLVVPEYRQQYRKKSRRRERNSMFVNGRVYNL